MKETSDRLIIAILALLLIFGALSFFFAPAYEKGVWLILGCITAGLSALFGFKFGVHVPKPSDGSTQVTLTQTPPALPEKEIQ